MRILARQVLLLLCIFGLVLVLNGCAIMDRIDMSIEAAEDAYDRSYAADIKAYMTDEEERDMYMDVYDENSNWWSGLWSGQWVPWRSDEAKEASKRKWAKQHIRDGRVNYEDSYKEKLNEKEAEIALEKQREAEQKRVEQAENNETGKNSLLSALPVIIVLVVVLLLACAGIYLRSTMAKPKVVQQKAAPPSSENTEHLGELAVDYDRYLHDLCSEKGLQFDDMLAQYGTARAAVEALYLQ